jgi:hypothetical protein
MNSEAFIAQLETSAGMIRQLVEGVSAEQAGWKFAPKRWSILEVTVHLLDEEREDFRTRLDLLLHKPSAPWPPIDPQGWVTQRGYAQRDLDQSLQDFLKERAHSVRWLRGLDSPDWTAAKKHPVAGSMTAGDMLSSWVAHDFLHIRQLARLHWEFIRHGAQPYSVAYAGDW